MEGFTYLECLKELTSRLACLENSNNQARWLMCHVLGIDINQLILSTDTITKKQSQILESCAKKLINGYPLQYLLGSTEFMGLTFKTRENVLIPRNDTEVLCQHIINYIGNKELSVLDMCCGSGCIGLSIKYYCKNTHVTLCDISDYALDLTKENAASLNLDVEIIKSDLFKNITNTYDVLVSNPPYIETKQIPTLSKQVLYEPKLALDGKEDGLYFYKRISKEYQPYINENGMIFLEIGHNQGQSVAKLFKEANVYQDLHNIDRVIVARR